MWLFHPTSIKEMTAKAKTMSPIELVLVVLTGMFWTVYGLGSFVIKTFTFFYSTLVSLMSGSEKTVVKPPTEPDSGQKKAPIGKLKQPAQIVIVKILTLKNVLCYIAIRKTGLRIPTYGMFRKFSYFC